MSGKKLVGLFEFPFKNLFACLSSFLFCKGTRKQNVSRKSKSFCGGNGVPWTLKKKYLQHFYAFHLLRFLGGGGAPQPRLSLSGLLVYVFSDVNFFNLFQVLAFFLLISKTSNERFILRVSARVIDC